MATPSRTHLCNLIQQFVVFLPFLQGAQIAAHSSCQGNGAECPPECVRRLRCVCELPPGAKHTRAPLPWLPPLLSLIRVSSEIPPPFHLLQAQETHSHTQTHTHTRVWAHCYSRAWGCSSFSVCVGGECVSGEMSKSTLRPFPSCLSLLPLILTSCMPTYTLSPLSLSLTLSLSGTSSSQCERTLVRTHTFGLTETHLLPCEAAYTCLLPTSAHE